MALMLRFPASRHWDLTPLRKPLWWGALAILLINDNLLKGQGIAPGWLTGKLSDFAFLVIAPVLFAALLPLALPLRRSFAIASVVAVFAGADLSPGFSDGVIALAARLGLRWRLWPDPTDLLALCVLPWTIRLLRSDARSGPARVRLRERVAIVAGAFACLATSSAEDEHGPFFLNRMPDSIDLRVTWLLKQVDCESTPTEVFATLNRNDFDDPLTLHVRSGQVALLARTQPASPVGMCPYSASPGSDACIAALLEADGAPPVFMLARNSWMEYGSGGFISCNAPDYHSRCEPRMDRGRDPGPDAISLAEPGRFLADHGATERSESKVNFAPVDLAALDEREPAANSCRDLRAEFRELIGQASCAEDSDCEGVTPPSLPGEQPRCDLVVHRDAAARLRTLAAAWYADCVAGSSGCGRPVFGACRNATCVPLCEVVPSRLVCSEPCSTLWSDRSRAEFCAFGGICIDEAGAACRCGDNALVCEPESVEDAARCATPCLYGGAAGSRAGAAGAP